MISLPSGSKSCKTKLEHINYQETHPLIFPVKTLNLNLKNWRNGILKIFCFVSKYTFLTLNLELGIFVAKPIFNSLGLSTFLSICLSVLKKKYDFAVFTNRRLFFLWLFLYDVNTDHLIPNSLVCQIITL